MEKYHKITRQIGFNYISMVLILFFSPVLIYYLTRYLTLEQYGAYAIISVTVEIAIVLLELGLYDYMVTMLSGMSYKKKIESFFSLVGLEIFLFILLNILFFLTPIQKYAINILKLNNYTFEFKIGVAIILLGLLIRLYSSYYAANKKLEFQSFIAFLLKSAWVIFVIVFVSFFKRLNLLTSMYLWFLGVLITFLVCFFYSRKDFFNFIRLKKINFPLIKEGVVFSAPLVFFYMGAYVIALADRYILNYYTTLALVGIYTLAYSLCYIILSLGITISKIIYPYIAEAWHKNKDHNLLYNASFKYNLMVVFPSIVGIYVLRKPIITLISGVNYLDSAKVIPILILFPLLGSMMHMFYQNMLLRKKTKQVGLIYLIGGILNMALNIILIPPYNMYGAAIATTITYFFMFIVMYILCHKYIEVNFDFMKVGRMILASILMGVLVYFISPTIIWTKIITIAAGAICYFSLLFLFGFFSKEEVAVMKSFLIKTLRKGKIV